VSQDARVDCKSHQAQRPLASAASPASAAASVAAACTMRVQRNAALVPAGSRQKAYIVNILYLSRAATPQDWRGSRLLSTLHHPYCRAAVSCSSAISAICLQAASAIRTQWKGGAPTGSHVGVQPSARVAAGQKCGGRVASALRARGTAAASVRSGPCMASRQVDSAQGRDRWEKEAGSARGRIGTKKRVLRRTAVG